MKIAQWTVWQGGERLGDLSFLGLRYAAGFGSLYQSAGEVPDYGEFGDLTWIKCEPVDLGRNVPFMSRLALDGAQP